MPRIRWKATLTAQELAPLIAIADASIAAIQADIQQLHAFVPYHAGGAQQAVTTVNWPPAGPQRYTTHMQEHPKWWPWPPAPAALRRLGGQRRGGACRGQPTGFRSSTRNYFTRPAALAAIARLMLWVIGPAARRCATEGRYKSGGLISEYNGAPANVLNNGRFGCRAS